LGRRPLGAVLHSSNEPGELLQWVCHDDSTINIVLDIIIIIIIIIIGLFYKKTFGAHNYLLQAGAQSLCTVPSPLIFNFNHWGYGVITVNKYQ